jgi:hypothetical protein
MQTMARLTRTPRASCAVSQKALGSLPITLTPWRGDMNMRRCCVCTKHVRILMPRADSAGSFGSCCAPMEDVTPGRGVRPVYLDCFPGSQGRLPGRRLWGEDTSMKRVARTTYHRIFGIPLLIFALAAVTALNLGPPVTETMRRSHTVPPVLLWSASLFLFWLVFGRRIALWLLPWFISHFTCPGCRKAISPVGVWNCGCGYHGHRRRHVLSGTCPKCGARAAHLDCPRCSCTLLLW